MKNQEKDEITAFLDEIQQQEDEELRRKKEKTDSSKIILVCACVLMVLCTAVCVINFAYIRNFSNRLDALEQIEPVLAEGETADRGVVLIPKKTVYLSEPTTKKTVKAAVRTTAPKKVKQTKVPAVTGKTTTETTTEKKEKVNISTADAEELQKLKGVGKSLAQKIIDYREEHPFAYPEQIAEVDGISYSVYEENMDIIVVD